MRSRTEAGGEREVLTVTVIIPALNEEESIGQVLATIPAGAVGEILVVDGGSSDRTVAIAQGHGARVIHEPRRGYGRACAAGVDAAQGDVVLFLDADGADDPAQIPDLLAPLHAGQADMVLGSRLAGKLAPGAMPWHQRSGNRLAAWLIRHLYGLPLTDLSPFRAVDRELLLGLNMEEMTYGWPTEMIVKAAQRGWRVFEIPTHYRPRIGGRSKISGTLRGSTLATYYILWTIFRHARTGPMGDPVVVIMAKQPVVGQTKTRLCPPLAPVEATALYEAMLRDTIELVSGLDGVQTALAVTPPEAASTFFIQEGKRSDTLLEEGGKRSDTSIEQAGQPDGAIVLPVAGADIGECLDRALGRLLAAGHSRVIALNSDGPTLPVAYLQQAIARLDSADVVLGPSADGGYYLIGLKQPQPELFRDIEWSTERVTAQTLAKAKSLGLAVALLPPWYDVDTGADLDRLHRELATLPAHALSHTRHFFARRGYGSRTKDSLAGG